MKALVTGVRVSILFPAYLNVNRFLNFRLCFSGTYSTTPQVEKDVLKLILKGG